MLLSYVGTGNKSFHHAPIVASSGLFRQFPNLVYILLGYVSNLREILRPLQPRHPSVSLASADGESSMSSYKMSLISGNSFVILLCILSRKSRFWRVSVIDSSCYFNYIILITSVS